MQKDEEGIVEEQIHHFSQVFVFCPLFQDLPHGIVAELTQVRNMCRADKEKGVSEKSSLCSSWDSSILQSSLIKWIVFSFSFFLNDEFKKTLLIEFKLVHYAKLPHLSLKNKEWIGPFIFEAKKCSTWLLPSVYYLLRPKCY